MTDNIINTESGVTGVLGAVAAVVLWLALMQPLLPPTPHGWLVMVLTSVFMAGFGLVIGVSVYWLMEVDVWA